MGNIDAMEQSYQSEHNMHPINLSDEWPEDYTENSAPPPMLSEIVNRLDRIEKKIDSLSSNNQKSNSQPNQKKFSKIIVPGISKTLDTYTGAYATFSRTDSGLRICAPTSCLNQPLEQTETADGVWTVVPLKLASGVKKFVGILPAEQGGEVGEPFPSTMDGTTGMEMVFCYSWCNVSEN